jgi:alpha-tubulin suppressor-like RCC1 family protein
MNHACAITGSGNNSSVYCWGDNSFSQLGLNNGNEVYAPILVPGFSGAQKISAGQGHTCAMMNDQRVKCVGAVFNGMIQTSPTYISNVTNALSISSGSHHTCAVVTTGTTNVNQVKCWGRKGVYIDFFQYGMGPFGYTSDNSAMTIRGLSAVSRVFSGPNSKSTFSVSNAGILKSWGRDDVEQLAIEKKNFVLPIELNQIPVSDY